MDVRQVLSNPARSLDESGAVAVVFFHAGRDGKDVGIEDHVFGRKSDLVDQDVVCAPGDCRLALERIGLAFFIERHHNHRRAITAYGTGVIDEGRLTLLQRD